MFDLLLAGRQHAFRHLTVNSLKPRISRSLYTLNKEETEEAKRWLEKIRFRPLQRSDVELTFARSSGPGGYVSSLTASIPHLRHLLWIRL